MTELFVPTDGRLTSQNILSGPLDGTDVMYIVSPGNAAEGNSYQVTLNTLSSFLGGGGGGRATSDVTYYVNADTGDDSNPGTLGSPFKTQVHAWDTVAAINGNGYRATIQLQDAAAVYDGVNWDPNFGNVTLTPFGWQKITIKGNPTTRLNTKVSSRLTPFSTCYSFSNGAIGPLIQIQDMAMSSDGAPVDSGSIFVSGFVKVSASNLYLENLDFSPGVGGEGFFEYEGDLYIYAVDETAGSLITAEGPCFVIFEPSSVTIQQNNPNPANQVALAARDGAYIQCFLPDLSAYDSLWDFKFWIDNNATLYCNSLDNIPGISPGIVTNGAAITPGPRKTDPGWISQLCPTPVLDNLTVSQLPSTCIQGSMALVTDSTTSHAALSPVTGGGSTIVPVIFIANEWVYLVAV